jgi:decaprenylphospho-beta-D-erythro-pentofuranosid-2-ulose 2-reductase
MAELTWLVLGGSSPVGRAFAREALRKGHAVVLAGRDTADLEVTAEDARLRIGGDISVAEFDATAYDKHQEFVDACVENKRGALGVFICFGVMPGQDEIDGDFDKARQTIEVNYLGAVSVLSRVAPVLEKERAGHIVVLGSVAGDRGRRRNYVYGSAKAGLHTYLQGLRARLYAAGVSVTTVKPGFMDTQMTWGDPRVKRPPTPEAVARACLRFAEKGADVKYYPLKWWPIMTVVKLIPERVFKRLNF